MAGENQQGNSKIPWIDEESLAKKHPAIYHYTNFINLRSILESKGLRASPFNETNDRDEFRAAKSIICPLIAQNAKSKLSEQHPQFLESIRANGLDPDNLIRKDSEIFYDSGMTTNTYRPQIIAFSAHSEEFQNRNGILTMWRAYGGKDGSIAIGYNTKSIVEKSEQLQIEHGFSAIYLDEAIYGAADNRLQPRVEDCDELVEIHYKFLAAQLVGQEPQIDFEGLKKLLVLSACVKHVDFSDEREIRMIVGEPENSATYKPIKRHGLRMVIEIADCIERILVGPSRDQSAIAAAVCHTLTEFGLHNIEVRLSNTPFRAT